MIKHIFMTFHLLFSPRWSPSREKGFFKFSGFLKGPQGFFRAAICIESALRRPRALHTNIFQEVN